MKRSNLITAVSAVIAYFVMVVVNTAANILPINNISTGEVSDSFPNLFAPAGITFSIWGVIYLTLGIYTFYLLTRLKYLPDFIDRINRYYILTSLTNAVWIFAWHYGVIWLTVLLMLFLLICLIKISDILNSQKLTTKEKLIIKLPFGIYFGWITIATIANITAFLVDIGWNGFGLQDTFWMIIVLITGVFISSWRMIKERSIAYGLVPVWAYFGIWLKHSSSTGFNGQYPQIITVTILCLLFLIFINSYLAVKKHFL